MGVEGFRCVRNGQNSKGLLPAFMAKRIVLPLHGVKGCPRHTAHEFWPIRVMVAATSLTVAAHAGCRSGTATLRPLRQLIGRATAQKENGEYEQEVRKNA